MVVKGHAKTDSAKLDSAAWCLALDSFRAAHAEWWRLRATRDAVYSVPEEVVSAMRGARVSGSEHRDRKALLSDADIAAETAFTRLCRQSRDPVVGVWNGLARENKPTPIKFRELVQVPAANDSVRRLRQQTLGYVGWLTFNEEYRTDLKRLSDCWDSLLEFQKPSFPLRLHDTYTGLSSLLGPVPAGVT
jgi:hypothetical protein